MFIVIYRKDIKPPSPSQDAYIYMKVYILMMNLGWIYIWYDMSLELHIEFHAPQGKIGLTKWWTAGGGKQI